MHPRLHKRTATRCTVFLFAFTVLFASTNDAEAFEWKQTCEDNNSSQNKCERDEVPLPLAWEEGCLTFGLSNPPPGAREGVVRALNSSFEAWNRVACSGMAVAFDAEGSHDNDVSFENDDWEHSRTSFAVTVVSFDPGTGAIADAQIKVNEANYDFETRDSGPSQNAPDLQNTITHEVGHALGFAHSDVRAATMYGGAASGETDKRTLHSDDIDGLCESYSVESVRDTCGAEPDEDQNEFKSDAPTGASDEFGSWGGGSSGTSGNSAQAACSVTTGARSVKLPVGSFLLFIVLSLLVRHGASIRAVRTRRRSRSPHGESDS